MSYAQNKTGGEHCPVCLDDGIVTIKGTITKHGYTYSRGSAPCKWCEAGTASYVKLQANRQDPASRFTLHDVEPPDGGARATAEEARAAIREIAAIWSGKRPLEEAPNA